MEQKSYMQWVLAVVALIAGLAGGYYFGLNRGAAQEKAAQKAVQDKALTEATKAVNPFDNSAANPYEKSQINPYDNIKVNPFQ